MAEIWRPIEGHTRYEVSSYGHVRDIARNRLVAGWIRRAKRSCYRNVKLDGCQLQVHRLVATAFIPNPEGLPFVDHRDCDGLHNHVENIRWVTPSQNAQNSRSKLGSSSIYKGVYWDKSHGKWRAQIKINGLLVNLGRFEQEIDAAAAYNRAAIANFGDFVRPNVMPASYI